MRVIIIGGVAGGATAAARIRRLDEKAEIIIFEKSGYISYANCGLPYYIGGVIEDKEELTLQTPESFWERFNIDVRVQNEALEINPENNDNSAFDGLTVGDKIKVSHGLVLETYPGRTDIFSLQKLSDGSIEDIPEEKLSQLEEIGWIAVSSEE